MKRLCILLYCCLCVMLIGIQPAAGAPAVEISHDSWTFSPHLRLYEEADDFARLEFANNVTQNNWHIAGYPSNFNASAQLNFYWGPAGDVFLLKGNGQAEVRSPAGSIPALSFSSGNSQYKWGITGALTATPSADLLSFSHDSVGEVFRLSQSGLAEVGTLRISSIPAGSTSAALCAGASNLITTCSSSREYKKNIIEMRAGLGVVEKLRPVLFDWKETGEADLGLIAEEVAEVEPRLAVVNSKGKTEGVKYMNLTAVLVRAVQEQQAEIKEKDNRIAKLEKALEMIEGRLATLEKPAQTIAAK